MINGTNTFLLSKKFIEIVILVERILNVKLFQLQIRFLVCMM